jgi:uncharacterized protein (TIGR03000 family)
MPAATVQTEKPSVSTSAARLVVELPADATLTIDGKEMKTTSGRRVFRTPELEKGQVYYYTLKATVLREGKPVEQTKHVIVRAGEVAEARFSTMDTTSVASIKP